MSNHGSQVARLSSPNHSAEMVREKRGTTHSHIAIHTSPTSAPRSPGAASPTVPPSIVSAAPATPLPMGDRYRAYAPSYSYGRDPQADYPGYVQPEDFLPSYYSSRAPVIPGDYTSRAHATPGVYTSRAHVTPVDYTSRAPILAGDYTSRSPVPPADYASRGPVLPGGPDIIRNDVPMQSRAYGLDSPAGVTNHALPGLSGLTAGARAPGPSALEDPTLVGRGGLAPVKAEVKDPAFTGRNSSGGKRSGLAPVKAEVEDPALTARSSSLGISAGIPDAEHHSSLPNLDGPSEDESNILFVDGLPSDCTRREVAHLFRPFVGFKDIRVVHKEPRRSGDKGYVLCFVEFEDAKYAFTAMEALQEYRFDDRKPDAPVLKIHFARFPFCLPAPKDEKKRVH